jgi:flavin-dependent dehydrogenase
VSGLRDAVVVGGGPVGLAFAAAAARRGLSVTVLERAGFPVDKACGEGVLPAGVRALDALGVRPLLGPDDAAPLREIRWLEGDGACAALRLPAPGGLGVRRTALSGALAARARAAGAELRDGEEADLHRREPGAIVVHTRAGELRARVLVAADGLASGVRRREGLEVAPRRGPARYGLRRHLEVAPWCDAVEVHFGDGVEAYVTPAGRARLGVAFLFERGLEARFEPLLARFPALAARLAHAAPASDVRGAGPFERAARARVADRLVLLGDAAGYLDAVTGEGLSIGFACALGLADLLPEALGGGASAAALRPYERLWARHYRPYAAWTRLVLALSRRPALRRRVLALAGRTPAPFEALVARAVGQR